VEEELEIGGDERMTGELEAAGGCVINLDNFLIILIQKLFDMMMTYTQIDNLNVTHSKHAYLNEL
jgi:hypothetical protein